MNHHTTTQCGSRFWESSSFPPWPSSGLAVTMGSLPPMKQDQMLGCKGSGRHRCSLGRRDGQMCQRVGTCEEVRSFLARGAQPLAKVLETHRFLCDTCMLVPSSLLSKRSPPLINQRMMMLSIEKKQLQNPQGLALGHEMSVSISIKSTY